MNFNNRLDKIMLWIIVSVTVSAARVGIPEKCQHIFDEGCQHDPEIHLKIRGTTNELLMHGHFLLFLLHW